MGNWPCVPYDRGTAAKRRQRRTEVDRHLPACCPGQGARGESTRRRPANRAQGGARQWWRCATYHSASLPRKRRSSGAACGGGRGLPAIRTTAKWLLRARAGNGGPGRRPCDRAESGGRAGTSDVFRSVRRRTGTGSRHETPRRRAGGRTSASRARAGAFEVAGQWSGTSGCRGSLPRAGVRLRVLRGVPRSRRGRYAIPRLPAR